MDWSYELLTPAEQLLLRRLAVFSGWNLEMAERVCTDGRLPAGAVLDLLAALIDKSLVTLDGEVAGDVRYRLLDTIRQYAAERLAASGEEPVLRRRHRDCLVGLIEGVTAQAFRRGDPPWPVRLRMYKDACLQADNFAAALAWSFEQGETQPGLRLCTALRSPWVTDGDVADGANWLDQFLSQHSLGQHSLGNGSGSADVAPSILGRAFVARAELAFEQQEYPTVRRCAEAALEECRRAGDDSFAAGALRVLGSAELRLGNPERAQELADQAVAAARAVGDDWEEGLALGTRAAAAARQGKIREAQRSYEAALYALRDNNLWGAAHILYGLAILAAARGDHEASFGYFSDALEIFRELDARPEIARCLAGLGRLAMVKQDHALARSRLTESLQLSWATGQRLAMARGLEAFAQLAACHGQHARAVRLAGAARTLRAAIGESPASGARLEQLLEPARKLLGDQSTEAMLAEGAAMTADEAARYATDPSQMTAPLGMAGATSGQVPGGVDGTARIGGAADVGAGAVGMGGAAGHGDAAGTGGVAGMGGVAAVGSTAGRNAGGTSGARTSGGSVLTPREWEISELISRGLSNRAIADELVISPATAARHVANILTKLGFSSRAQVAAWATGRNHRSSGP